MSEHLADFRRELIEEFCRLSARGDVVQWQRHLAAAIIETEKPAGDADVAELKYHRHLLRVIGDMLAYTLLPSHTLRALSTSGPPASVAGQGENFDFVLQVATELCEQGFVPIVSDLTNLIGIGDLIGWRAEQIVVLECKNTFAPSRVSTSGRVARQRKRGEDLQAYLKTSKLEQPDGKFKAAISSALPEPEWERVQELVNECEASEQGIGSLALGAEDWLLAFDREKASTDALDQIMPNASAFTRPAIAPYNELTRASNYRNRSPSSYPLSAAQRWRLLEGEILLMRAVNLGRLEAEFVHDEISVQLRTTRTGAGLSLEVVSEATEGIAYLPPLVEYCLWTPISIDLMRDYFINLTRSVIDAKRGKVADANFLLPLAGGDDVMYSTLYRAESEPVGSD